MENEHSLKNWVRKHSPLRTKQLPLPPPDNDDRSSRPLEAISANISPSRRPSKNRLRSLLKQKSLHPETARPNPADQLVPAKQLRRQSMPLMAAPATQQHSGSIRKQTHQSSQSTDLHKLSMKISNLEAQLKEAKEQLDTAARHGSAIDGPQPPQYQHPTIRSIPSDQQKFVNANLPDVEFVHSLLIQREHDFRTHGMTCKSTTDLSYKPTYPKETDNILDHDPDPQQNLDSQSPTHHKRKLSQVRQASWEQVQSHLQERQSRCIRQQTHDSKRPRKEQGRPHSLRKSQSKELPEIPDFPMPNANIADMDNDEPNFFTIVDPADVDDDAEEQDANPYPVLDRHQRHFSQPPPLAPAPQTSASPEKPKHAKHRRSRSQIIDPEELRQLSPSRPSDDQAVSGRPPSRKSVASASGPRPVNPPSPTRRHCPSPIRLERVQEEYEWDEDVF